MMEPRKTKKARLRGGVIRGDGAVLPLRVFQDTPLTAAQTRRLQPPWWRRIRIRRSTVAAVAVLLLVGAAGAIGWFLAIAAHGF